MALGRVVERFGAPWDALRLLFGFADDFRGSSRLGKIALLRDEPAADGPPRGSAQAALL